MFPFVGLSRRGVGQNRVFGSGQVALPYFAASGVGSLSRMTSGVAEMRPLAASGAGKINRMASGSAALAKLAASGAATKYTKQTASGSAGIAKVAASGSATKSALTWTSVDSFTTTSGITDKSISQATYESQVRAQSSQVTIDAVSVYIKRSSEAYGTIIVSLFPGQGTVGSTGAIYSGANPVANTSGISCSSISSSYGWVRFEFASPFTWYPGTHTSIMVIALGGNGYTSGITVALNSGHAGNYCAWGSGPNSSYDMLFKLEQKSWS